MFGRFVAPVVARFLTRALAVFAAMLVLSQTAFATVLFECRMSGEVGPRCCCSAKARKVAPGHSAAFERQGCCTSKTIDGEATPASLSEPIAVLAMLERSVTLLEPEAPPHYETNVSSIPPRSRAPPNGWPPLFITYRSILS